MSFAADVAPVLLEQCANCHGANRDEGGLRMHTPAALAAGGVVEPGRGGGSLLVRKLRGVGIDGQRMPRGRPPLADAVIARIERWIDEGARIDLLGADATLENLVAAGRAARMSDDELAGARRSAAIAAWRRAIPDEEPLVEIRGRVSLVGNLPPARLAGIADDAATLEERVRADLVAGDGRLLKGGVVLFAFRNAYDYSAFWQEIIGGERPRGLTGHAGAQGEAVYGALLVPADDPDGGNTRLLLAEQICAAALVGRGAPGWFARGAGRSVAQRLVPGAVLAREWSRGLPAAAREVWPAAALLDGRSDPAAAATAAGGFVGTLAPTAAKLRPLVAALEAGGSFEAAFVKAFRTPPAGLYEAWAAKESRRRPAGR